MIPSPSCLLVIAVDVLRKIGRKERNVNFIIIKLINRSHITYQVKPCYISYKMILVIH